MVQSCKHSSVRSSALGVCIEVALVRWEQGASLPCSNSSITGMRLALDRKSGGLKERRMKSRGAGASTAVLRQEAWWWVSFQCSWAGRAAYSRQVVCSWGGQVGLVPGIWSSHLWILSVWSAQVVSPCWRRQCQPDSCKPCMNQVLSLGQLWQLKLDWLTIWLLSFARVRSINKKHRY